MPRRHQEIAKAAVEMRKVRWQFCPSDRFMLWNRRRRITFIHEAVPNRKDNLENAQCLGKGTVDETYFNETHRGILLCRLVCLLYALWSNCLVGISSLILRRSSKNFFVLNLHMHPASAKCLPRSLPFSASASASAAHREHSAIPQTLHLSNNNRKR